MGWAPPGRTTGLLGDADGDPSNDLRTRGGDAVARAGLRVRAVLYGRRGDSWRVRQAGSLFDHAPGQDTSTFTLRALPRLVVDESDLTAAERRRGVRVCTAAGVTDEAMLAARALTSR